MLAQLIALCSNNCKKFRIADIVSAGCPGITGITGYENDPGQNKS